MQRYETTVGKAMLALTQRFTWMLSKNWDGTAEALVNEGTLGYVEPLDGYTLFRIYSPLSILKSTCG